MRPSRTWSGSRTVDHPDDVGDLGHQLGVGGELERLLPPGPHPVLAPGGGYRLVPDSQMLTHQTARPVRHPGFLRQRPARSAPAAPDRPARVERVIRANSSRSPLAVTQLQGRSRTIRHVPSSQARRHRHRHRPRCSRKGHPSPDRPLALGDGLRQKGHRPGTPTVGAPMLVPPWPADQGVSVPTAGARGHGCSGGYSANDCVTGRVPISMGVSG